jgi:subtilase family protein
MAREHNFLLGYGERLTRNVEPSRGGDEKRAPYEPARAKQRASAQLADVTRELFAIPASACPGDEEVVASLTMHPRYVSKSDFPDSLLRSVGLRSLGTKAVKITPEAWGIENPPEGSVSTEQIFVAGPKAAFRRWQRSLPAWAAETGEARDLQHIETIGAPAAAQKLRGIPIDRASAVLEVVLHNGGDHLAIVEQFARYARRIGAEPIMDRVRHVRGLSFVPVQIDPSHAEQLATFSFVRVTRGMPRLRPFRPDVTRADIRRPLIAMPVQGPVSDQLRVAVLDGGIPAELDLAKWVRLIEPEGIGAPQANYELHGAAVTSALLFGALDPGRPADRPLCNVDHIRVLDEKTGAGGDLDVLDVLDRVLYVVDHGDYEFYNLSIGPEIALDDDDVTLWTSELDQRLAGGRVFFTVAAGNDGEKDAESGLNRVQPPGDAVNVLTVGAAGSDGVDWERAPYSCTGPGRNPGVVKPDGLAFGGRDGEEFLCFMTSPRFADGVKGTSFAAPFALRSAVATSVHLGPVMTPLAIRALMIHRAEGGDRPKSQVGWGRFQQDTLRLLTCDDDEALVVFQSELPKGYFLRAPVPLPRQALSGFVTISATIVIAPEVDPENADAYTRGGLEISFRPDSRNLREYEDGRTSKHAKPIPFFSPVNMYGRGEYDLREDGKWEPCRKAKRRFQAATLFDPVFDIYHHSRTGPSDSPVPYALIIGIEAPTVHDLYNDVVRTHSHILVPLRPQVQIPIRT